MSILIYFKLKELLDKEDLKPADLHRLTGIRPSTIAAICNNSIKELPVGVLEKICDTLDCQPADFIENISADDLEGKRKVMRLEYSVPAATKKERQKLVEDAVAISTLDAPEPSASTKKLLDQFIDGNVTPDEMLKRTIQRYTQS